MIKKLHSSDVNNLSNFIIERLISNKTFEIGNEYFPSHTNEQQELVIDDLERMFL